MRCTPALLAVPLLLLSGCTKTIGAGGAEKSVAQVVSSHTQFTPKDVKCPSGLDAKVGKTFDCHFTGPGGTRYTAHMEVTAVKGSAVHFQVSTAPTTP